MTEGPQDTADRTRFNHDLHPGVRNGYPTAGELAAMAVTLLAGNSTPNIHEADAAVNLAYKVWNKSAKFLRMTQTLDSFSFATYQESSSSPARVAARTERAQIQAKKAAEWAKKHSIILPDKNGNNLSWKETARLFFSAKGEEAESFFEATLKEDFTHDDDSIVEWKTDGIPPAQVINLAAGLGGLEKSRERAEGKARSAANLDAHKASAKSKKVRAKKKARAAKKKNASAKKATSLKKNL